MQGEPTVLRLRMFVLILAGSVGLAVAGGSPLAAGPAARTVPVQAPNAPAVQNQQPQKDAPKKEEPKQQESKKDGLKKDEPKKEEPKKEEPQKVEPKKEEPKADPNARTFTPKFEKDKAFYQELKTQVSQIIKVQGQDATQKQESTYYFKWTPQKQDGDKWVLEQEVEGLKLSIDISGNTINYDSSLPDGGVTAGNPGLMEFFKKLVGTKFTVTLNKGYQVEAVAGRDEFVRKLAAGSNQMESMLRNIVTDDAIRQMCDPTFGIVPDSPKKPGDTWDHKTKVSLGPIGTYEITYKFKYVGPGTEEGKKEFDKIEVETDLVYTVPKSTSSDSGLMFRIREGKLEVPKGSGEQPPKGVIYFDPRTQRVVSAEIVVKLKGELTVTIGMTDTKVELYQEQKTTLRTGDSSFMGK